MAANRNNHAVGVLALIDVEHTLVRDLLEKKDVTSNRRIQTVSNGVRKFIRIHMA